MHFSLLLTSVLFILLASCSSNQSPSENNLGGYSTGTDAIPSTMSISPEISPFPTESATVEPSNTPEPSATPAPTPTPELDLSNAIVFVSDRGGTTEIYRMNGDGSGLVKLSNQIESHSPAWSYDKSQVLFLVRDNWNNRLFVMKHDGSDLVDFTPEDLWVSGCEWSPKSLIIACYGNRRNDIEKNELMIIDVEDPDVENFFGFDGYGVDISWSPDGEKIALSTAGYVGAGLLIFNLPDGRHQELNLGNGHVDSVAWSNSGDQLAYSFGPYMMGVWTDLYTVNTNGNNIQRWTKSQSGVDVYAWDPSDTFILVNISVPSEGKGYSVIFAVDLIDDELVQLTDTKTSNYSPDYSRDGANIVFVSARDGQSEIYSMKSDGSEQMNLTSHPSDDYQPDW